MSGLFQGLEIGKRALLSHQLTMNTIGHNVANINTPGYTRQRTLLKSAQPLVTANYNLGNGVTVQSIDQVRDMFLTMQYRRESKSLGQWQYREKALSQIETFFAEPNDDSLGDVLNQFWASWLDLSNNPESSAARSAVASQADKVANVFHSIDQQLKTMQATADLDVTGRVDQINQIIKEIANLNRLVVSEELGGQKANDLRDQRDYLIDNLSKIVDVNTQDRANGSVSVYISGMALVDNADAFLLDTVVNSNGNRSQNDIVWKNSRTGIKITGGELKAMLDTRDVLIPQYQNQLDQLASSIIREVNNLHVNGTGLDGVSGRVFFDSTYVTAATIRLDQRIAEDSARIAVSLSGEPGDNANALALAGLRDQVTMAYGTMSITEYYNAMIGDIGLDTHEAQTFKGNFEVLLNQIENSRESIQGVSLDEEMAEMVRQQHAYDAAARVITYIDSALDTLINGMGIVGR